MLVNAQRMRGKLVCSRTRNHYRFWFDCVYVGVRACVCVWMWMSRGVRIVFHKAALRAHADCNDIFACNSRFSEQLRDVVVVVVSPAPTAYENTLLIRERGGMLQR